MPVKPKVKEELIAQNPLILRCHRLMEAFAKSDDERDFYLDRVEGFILYVDLDKPHQEIAILEQTLKEQPERYCVIPKLTFYESKKIMEGFVNEKVYDIDTKEKLLDIISSKSARENFLEFIYDHHAEQEKWQQYYQERSRIRIIEWLRKNHFQFVFEEDLDLTRSTLEKLKTQLFQKKVGKDVETARKALFTKAKSYYSNEALNPRPKRGRPPKQVAKLEIEPQVSMDIYTTVSPEVRPFLFTPDIGHAWLATFSSKFDHDRHLSAGKKSQSPSDLHLNLENLNKKLETLRQLSSKLADKGLLKPEETTSFEEEEEEDEEEDLVLVKKDKKAEVKKKAAPAKPIKKVQQPVKTLKAKPLPSKKPAKPLKKKKK